MSSWWFIALIVTLGILLDKRVRLPGRLAELRRHAPTFKWTIILGVIGFLGLREFVNAMVDERFTKDSAIFAGTAFVVCAAALYKQPWRRER